MPSMKEEYLGGSRFSAGTEIAGTKSSIVFLLELASTYQHASSEAFFFLGNVRVCAGNVVSIGVCGAGGVGVF